LYAMLYLKKQGETGPVGRPPPDNLSYSHPLRPEPRQATKRK
jgi:hypothetical protein